MHHVLSRKTNDVVYPHIPFVTARLHHLHKRRQNPQDVLPSSTLLTLSSIAKRDSRNQMLALVAARVKTSNMLTHDETLLPLRRTWTGVGDGSGRHAKTRRRKESSAQGQSPRADTRGTTQPPRRTPSAQTHARRLSATTTSVAQVDRTRSSESTSERHGSVRRSANETLHAE